MGLGEDISEVLEELGSTIEVYKHDTEETYTEYVDSEQEVLRHYVFDTHFITLCTLAYNTNAKAGDRISFTDYTPPGRFLLGALTEELFEKERIARQGIIFRCNVSAEVKRRNTNRVDYNAVVSWPTQNSGEYALFTGHEKYIKRSDKEYGTDVLDSNLLFISDDVNVQIKDRIVIRPVRGIPNEDLESIYAYSGENYEVDFIESHKYPGMKICRVSEDTRE